MAQNTFKHQQSEPRAPKVKKKRENRLYNYLNQTVGIERIFGEDNAWPIKHFDRIMWVSLLLIVYIGFNHNAERLVRRIQRTKSEVDELLAHYTTLKADFMKSGKQSEITKQVAPMGLTEPTTPPYKIVVKPEAPQP
ncbi:FtsL-like putative cell division protein [Larkinella soli]|uniref:FtsL-like putative cell division protein n=1 Tax=Larkinella soli TaxID=1770527 RepID=UPI000FFC04EB|nr:FtsL-like putative cell division protein [Larkinella soli]